MTILAQTTGVLSGKVVDEDGKPLIGAVIRLVGTTQGGLSKSPNGQFTIAGVRAGEYTVSIKAIGYTEVTRTTRVSVGQTSDLGSVKLTSQAVKGTEVVVKGNRNAIVPEKTGTVRSVNRDELDRSTRTTLVGAVGLANSVSTAGVNGFSIRGGRASETSIRVDGVEVSDPFTGGFGSVASGLYPTPSTLAMEEVQVIPSGFSAEYGHVLSGVVNSVTRNGRNDRYEGSFRFRMGLSALNGSSDPITVKKAGTDVDTTLPGSRYQSSGLKSYEFGFGGPFPGFSDLTFFLSGRLETRDFGGGFEVYDVTPEYAAPRKAIAEKLWGTALTPVNLGQLPDQESAVRDLNAKFKLSLTDEIYMELGAEYGLTTRELGGWQNYYMNDHPATMQLNPVTKVYDSVGVNPAVKEGEAVSADQNKIITRLVAHYFQSLDPTTYFELTGSYVNQNDELGKKDESKSYFILSPYDIPYPEDLDNDVIIDRYALEQAPRFLNQYLLTDSGTVAMPVMPTRNHLTGLIEGGEDQGASMNPYGMSYDPNNDFGFPVHGNPRSLDFRKSNWFTLKGGYETNFDLGEVKSQVKAGFDFSTYTLRRHNNSLAWNGDPFFDIYGYESNYFKSKDQTGKLTEFFKKPYTPYEGALYVQTSFKYQSITFQPGVRFDFLNPNSQAPPLQRSSIAEVIKVLDTTEDAALKFQVSPRIGISYPVTDKSQFRVNFAMMFKMPEFNLLFDNAFGDAQRGNQIFGNPDIEPQKEFNYELGYEAEFADDYYIDINAFYRDIYNQTGTLYVPSVPSGYNIYTVQEYGNVRGLEISARRNLVDNIHGELNYTLQRATGTSSSPTSNYLVTSGIDPYTGETRTPPLTEYPLSYDVTHSVNATAGIVWNDGEGPSIGGVNLLENTDLTLTFTYRTGLPYTRYNQKGEQIGEYLAERQPAQFNTEMHLERGFKLRGLLGEGVGNLELSIFADVTNLLNSTTVWGYFDHSGSPDNNGTTEDRKIGDFVATPFYRDIDPNRPETYSIAQYDRFGTRLYNPYADVNLDGVVTQLEKYEGYQRYVATLQNFRGNYQTPRTAAVGFKIRF